MFVASVSFSTAAVKLHADRRGRRPISSPSLSLQNFGGTSWFVCATGHQHVDFGVGRLTVPLLVAAGVALVFGCGSYGLLSAVSIGNWEAILQNGSSVAHTEPWQPSPHGSAGNQRGISLPPSISPRTFTSRRCAKSAGS